MGRFTPRPGLDAIVAERFGRPAIARVLDMLQDEAQRRAPAVRVWITQRDERVRRTHFLTDEQLVPDNLRFKLPKADGTGHDLARHPRDPDLPIEQRIHCRCDDPKIEHLLAESIHTSDVRVEGNRAHGQVYTDFHRAAESEHGTDKDQPARFMGGALDEVAARLRAGQAR